MNSRPLIAILRGLRPDQAARVGETLVEQGFGTIEVPLNSPEPLESISILVKEFGNTAVIGAGTVLTPGEVRQVADCGARLIVSPNTRRKVITETRRLGMTSLPGAFTATECLKALDSGADGIKLFPAGLLGTSGVVALRAVLPASAELYAVGGVGPDNFASWLNCGVTGLGIGSNLFVAGMTIGEIGKRAASIIEAFDLASGKTDGQSA